MLSLLVGVARGQERSACVARRSEHGFAERGIGLDCHPTELRAGVMPIAFPPLCQQRRTGMKVPVTQDLAQRLSALMVIETCDKDQTDKVTRIRGIEPKN